MRRYLILATLTFLLITTALPTVAQFEVGVLPATTSEIDRGRQLYQNGQLAGAVQLWEQAAQGLEERGERVQSALCYSYLAIAYQDLGEWEAAQNAMAQAETLGQSRDEPLLHAKILNARGSLQLNQGDARNAIATWQQAEQYYRAAGDTNGIVLSQINQAQALQTLGLYRRAKQKLETLNGDLAALPDSLLKARGLSSLGAALQVIGDSEQSQTVLEKSLEIAQKLNSPADASEILFRLGNAARSQSQIEDAIAFYQQASAIAPQPQTRLEADLNQLSLLVGSQQIQQAQPLIESIRARLAQLPPSRWSVYARVNLGESWIKLREKSNNSPQIAQLLARAVQQARSLKDAKAEAYGLGQLGYLYEQTGQDTEALELTEAAIAIAQNLQAPALAAPWYWQQGRLLGARGNTENAIAAYEQAVDTLEFLRQDLVAVTPDAQFSFRERVEPVYRQLVQLLLQDVDSLAPELQQQRLQRSRQVIEALQLAELENFFREACLTYEAQPIDEIDSQAAAFYPIVLDGRLETILSVPGEPLQHYGTELSPEAAETVFRELRQSLNLSFAPSEGLPPAQKLYNWLVRPAEAALQRQGIKTLVFVLDGFLRSLPMAVLHDGEQYLVEKYAVALSPGLQLLESQRAVVGDRALTLAGGLAEARQGFAALPGVEVELQEITQTLPAQVLLNETFIRPTFRERIEGDTFSVVHLATHGQFSSKAEETFILTWDGRIEVKELDALLRGKRDRDPIELLVLSACQTAKGDERAALGLAGVAVRSGARSTVATLWSVQDRSTARLMSEFYRRLVRTDLTKAEALRQAQLVLLRSRNTRHPYYWAPFVLVGNWL
ncbi:MAG: CHAT domain-containing protein [Cyanobacteriota bacterium]|nr:CHAT domain-containing protein [Cyanobacteriota bacterium]